MRERIIGSAMEQIKKYGFRRFTIEDIAADLQISKKTVYKHFESKDELISAVCTAHIELGKRKLLEAMTTEGSWLDRMLAFIRQDCQNDGHCNQLALELKQYFPQEWQQAEDMRRSVSEQMRIFFKQGVASGDIRAEINIDVLEIIIKTSIDVLSDFEFLKQHDLSFKQVFEEFKKVFMFGILTNESQLRGAVRDEK